MAGCVKLPEASAIPDEQLHAVAAMIDKDINIAAGGITQLSVGDNPAQTVKAFSHVSGLGIQIKMESGKDGQHVKPLLLE